MNSKDFNLVAELNKQTNFYAHIMIIKYMSRYKNDKLQMFLCRVNKSYRIQKGMTEQKYFKDQVYNCIAKHEDKLL